MCAISPNAYSKDMSVSVCTCPDACSDDKSFCVCTAFVVAFMLLIIISVYMYLLFFNFPDACNNIISVCVSVMLLIVQNAYNKGMNEGNVLLTHSTHFYLVILHHTYRKGRLR